MMFLVLDGSAGLSWPLRATFSAFPDSVQRQFVSLALDRMVLPAARDVVIANSHVVSDKAIHAKYQYNLRAIESLGATRMLMVRLGVRVYPTERIMLREAMASSSASWWTKRRRVDKVRRGLSGWFRQSSVCYPTARGTETELG